MKQTAWPVLVALGQLACGGSSDGMADAAPPDAPPDGREIVADLVVDESGFSPELTFTVPSGSRSATIVVTGADGALYALGAFTTADGVEHVGLDTAVPPAATMRASYEDEQIGHMPGDLYQSIRLGTFTHVYPYRPDQTLPGGETSLRVASDVPGPVRVTVLLPEDDGSRVLHVNLIAVSESLTLTDPPSFAAEAQSIFDQAGILIAYDDVIALRGTGLSSITDFTEPQEAPGSMSAMLPGLVTDLAPGALDVFVVDSLPSGVGGLSLGTPGPPVRGSYYYGVVLANQPSLARVFAHEVAHFLALQHVANLGISGAVYPDPLDDTETGQGNLMEGGTAITADQTYGLQRSALLQP